MAIAVRTMFVNGEPCYFEGFLDKRFRLELRSINTFCYHLL